MDNELRLVWTRAPFYWHEDKKKLEDKQINYVYLPCIQYNILSKVNIPFEETNDKNRLVIFTNFLSAKILTKDIKYKELLKKSRIFTMGDRTFQLLRKKNLNATFIKSKTAYDFAQSIQKKLNKPHTIYLPGPETRAFDMKSYFEYFMHTTYTINCYQTIQKTTNINDNLLSSEEKTALISNKNNIFSFASPSAVNSLLFEFNKFKATIKKNFTVIAIGETTEKICKKNFYNTIRTKEPNTNLLVEEFLKIKHISERKS